MIELNLATADEVAAALGLSKQTLAHWRVAKIGPPFVSIGRRIRYPIASLKEWVSSQVRFPEVPAASLQPDPPQRGPRRASATPRTFSGYKTKREKLQERR